jgi:hypothetical protein
MVLCACSGGLESNVANCKGAAGAARNCLRANGRREFAPDLTRTLLRVTRPSGIAADSSQPYLTARSTYHGPSSQMRREEWQWSVTNLRTWRI